MKWFVRHIYILLSILFFAACNEERGIVPVEDVIPEGYMKISFKTVIAEPRHYSVRAVDPDGLGVNNMTLFCFNEFGLYITSVEAELTSTDIEDGHFEAVIPNHTQIVHFLGNHSKGLYDDSGFNGQTESMVMANMEGGSGMLVYWSRFQMDSESDKTMQQQLTELKYTVGGSNVYKGVKLIRNQAKVSIASWENDYFTVTGFRTVNIPAFGTVAPHHPDLHFEVVDNWEEIADFVCLPSNDAKMSDIHDINTKNEDYVFESDNDGDNLMSVIIKGRNKGSNEELYYRVVLQNEDGSSFMIRRNHHYVINITGTLSYGCKTFEEALVSAATNNAWISIDEWINEITNGTETLWVEKTTYVLSSEEFAGTDWVLPYRYTQNGKGVNDAPTVTWVENNLAYTNFGHEYNTTTGEGRITLRLFPMYDGNEMQSGTLLIKHGKLQRKVNVIIIRKQKFTPAWVSAQVYSGVSKENVTVMFTIPETTPETLFPITVLVSSNNLDVRAESGMRLPVLVKGEEGYFGEDWDNVNYKYVYTATAPGKHRLFMQTILLHENGETEDVHLEAEFFETITKSVSFNGKGVHKAIFIDGLHTYGNHYAVDEALYYMLVPQKKASPVMFNFALRKRNSDGTYSPIDHTQEDHADHDEFLIYSRALSMYDEYYNYEVDKYVDLQDNFWECQVKIFNQDSWSTNGRVMGLRTCGYEADGSLTAGLQTDGTYNVYMLTNSTSNKDVVRMASNKHYNNHVFTTDRNGNLYGGDGNVGYDGNEYRSVIFDIGHYRAFRFAPQIRVYENNSSQNEVVGTILSNEADGSKEEAVDEVLFNYKPGQLVDIMLDITSFKGSDGRSVHPFGELFGESFEVYIDAPMLEIDKSRMPQEWFAVNNPKLTVDKLRADPKKAGRFIYTVERLREEERAFGDTTALNKDASREKYDKYGTVVAADAINQSGERKLLPFVKNSITVEGNISISSNKEKVVYWDKTFEVDTRNICGKLQYRTAGGMDYDVPHDAFIAFVRSNTGARIGVMAVTADGEFELNLREEYRYSWEDDPIELYYAAPDGNIYVKNLNDISTLYEMTKRGVPVILEEDVD